MKIEASKVTKLLISEVQGLDPITVFLEDYEPGKGKITVSCWGKSWTAYWGGMRHTMPFHPTWELEYLPWAAKAACRTSTAQQGEGGKRCKA